MYGGKERESSEATYHQLLKLSNPAQRVVQPAEGGAANCKNTISISKLY